MLEESWYQLLNAESQSAVQEYHRNRKDKTLLDRKCSQFSKIHQAKCRNLHHRFQRRFSKWSVLNTSVPAQYRWVDDYWRELDQIVRWRAWAVFKMAPYLFKHKKKQRGATETVLPSSKTGQEGKRMFEIQLFAWDGAGKGVHGSGSNSSDSDQLELWNDNEGFARDGVLSVEVGLIIICIDP